MSKLRNFLMVMLLPVLCLSLMASSLCVSAAAKQTKTSVTKLSTASTNDDFEDFGAPVKLRYTLDQFVGVRFALFSYSTEKTGGEATFKDFKIEIL